MRRAPFSCFKYSVPTNGVFYNGESLLPVDTGHQTQFELRYLWDRTNKLFKKKKKKKGSHAQNLARRQQKATAGGGFDLLASKEAGTGVGPESPAVPAAPAAAPWAEL